PGAPYQVLAANFTAAFGSGLVVGNTSGYTLTFTSAAKVQAYLPAGHTAAALNSSATNPTSTHAGVFGGQVTALTISLGLSGNGTPAGLGAVMVNTTQGPYSMSQILGFASSALSGGSGSPFTIAELNTLTTNLNESYDNCVKRAWAQQNV